ALHARLTASRPGYGWLSEEAPDNPARLGCAKVFVLDPIDGTRAFIAGERGFAIALALVDQGEVAAGVVHLPARDETYAARRGGGATLNGAPLQASARSALSGADMLISSAQLRPALWPGGPPPITRHFRPALAHRLCLVASGRFDGFVTLRPTWEWDAAAGEIIAREAGAEVTDRRGARARYNSASRQLDGMVAAPAGLHCQIMARLHGPAGPVLSAD
ncbi:MAG: inositol monophosphatase family protein, partial [Pseudomonadota bacterium]